jgi:hypothetical protein
MDMSPPIFSARWIMCYHMAILGPVYASNSSHTKHHEQQSNKESWSKYQSCAKMCPSCKTSMFKKCAHDVQHLCTLSMYIIIMHCDKRYQPWNVSIKCLYQCASTNMPTMWIHQYAIYECIKTCRPPCTNTTKWWIPYMYAKSSIKHVPINLLVGASTSVRIMHQL